LSEKRQPPLALSSDQSSATPTGIDDSELYDEEYAVLDGTVLTVCNFNFRNYFIESDYHSDFGFISQQNLHFNFLHFINFVGMSDDQGEIPRHLLARIIRMLIKSFRLLTS